MVRTSPSQALLFGGFGGEDSEGRYLDDLWEFDLQAYQWRRVNAVGEVPEKRSNYSIHSDSQIDQVVLFGGGALNKLRFNTVSVLDLKRMAWRTIAPDPAEDAPWERTYHSAEFSYPYLVVYGGEGVSNIDLEDCWAFNIQTSAWRKLEFSNAEEGPGQRRFHSTALVGSSFYVIGGCRENYELLGDIHRADLTGLFS
jgi:N-acetylneuraminic acid mutarotase